MDQNYISIHFSISAIIIFIIFSVSRPRLGFWSHLRAEFWKAFTLHSISYATIYLIYAEPFPYPFHFPLIFRCPNQHSMESPSDVIASRGKGIAAVMSLSPRKPWECGVPEEGRRGSWALIPLLLYYDIASKEKYTPLYSVLKYVHMCM